MRSSRLYVAHDLSAGAEILLDQTASHYLKHVLRLKTGAAVILFDGIHAIDYHGVVEIGGRQVSVAIEYASPVDRESPLYSEIIQGLGRSDHGDWTIQKTTELGVNRISLFNAQRSQKHLKASQVEKKLAHWRGVAISACEQCGRALIPEIVFYADLATAIQAASAQARFLLDFEAVSLQSELCAMQANALSILLGPEGGLNGDEIGAALAAGFRGVSLGPRVLRTETAAVSALVMAQSCSGDLK